VNQIPGLVRVQVIREGSHRCAVQAGHEDAVQTFVRRTAFESRSMHKIATFDGVPVIVL
jgi:hypothetical protein